MTMKLGRTVAAVVMLAASFAASAETTEFDTITDFVWGDTPGTITGIPRNSSTPTTITFTNAPAHDHCVPMLMTMLEKPGRYYLKVTTMASGVLPSMSQCGLALRN